MISQPRSTAKLTKKDIKVLFSRAKRVFGRSELFILLAPTINPIGQLVIVTSRLVGNAPERNKVRRRLKAIFYEELLYRQLYNCIVIIKKGGAKIPFAILKESLLKAYATAYLEEEHAQN
jgi:ribonuclease P protein component